jgi:DNA-binding transcriptional ArsR family regulator
MDDTITASVAKALAHPARLHILRLLAAQTECRGADVFSELPLAQSTISEHLRVVYCLSPGVFEDFISAVTDIASTATLCNSDGKVLT